MADVSRRDRAQMLLIVSLLIASVFVGLALVVNSAIYAENLATRETSGDTTESLEHVQLVERDLQELIDKSNAAVTGDDYDAVNNSYGSDLGLWSNSQERRYGATGRHVNYEQEYVTEGTRIQQTNMSRNFTAGNESAGKEEWSPVNGTTETGEFEMTIQRLSLLDATTATIDEMVSKAFHVVIEKKSSGDTWRIYLYRGVLPDTGYVLVETPSENFSALSLNFSSYTGNSCASQSENITMDLVNASFGGEHCSELEFYTDEMTGNSHNISYRNTKTSGLGGIVEKEDRVTGTYNITVDTRADRTPYYDPDSGDNPSAKAVIYESAVTIEFETRQTRHSNENVSAKWSPVA